MNKKGICFISGTIFPSQTGGPDNSTYWLAKHLVKLGYKILIISFYKNLHDKDIRKFGIKPNSVSDIEGVKIIFCKYLLYRPISFSFWRNIYNIYNSKVYQFIMTNSYFLFMNLFLILLFGKRVVLSPRGELEYGAISNKRFKKSLYIYLFNNFISNKIKFYHFTSEIEKKFARKVINFKKSKILNNFIPDNFNKKYINTTISNRKNFIYLGRLQEKKNIDLIINAYSKLTLEIKKNHNLVLVGKGEKKYVSHLKKLSMQNKSNKYIKFIGHKYSPQKEIYLSKSKYLFLVSKSENWGNVVLESLSVGTPVIISKTNPWNSLDKKCGFVVNISEKDIYNIMIKTINIKKMEYKKLINNSLKCSSIFFLSKNNKKISSFFR